MHPYHPLQQKTGNRNKTGTLFLEFNWWGKRLSCFKKTANSVTKRLKKWEFSLDTRNRILKINLPQLVCKAPSYLDTRVAAEVEIKLGWVCYAGVNGGSRRNVATCTTLKNEKQEKAEISNKSSSKKEWHVQAEQNAGQLCTWRSRASDIFIIYHISSNKRPRSNQRPPHCPKYQTSAPFPPPYVFSW